MATAKDQMRIVFMGTPDFAVPTMKALISHRENVVGVITQPDRPRGRGRKLASPPIKELADNLGLPVLQPAKIRGEDFREAIRSFKPDLIVVAAYGRILPGEIINIPPLGTINVHASLLPRYRGAAPIQWAIINGEVETGITIMQMNEGLDTGDILLMEKLGIDSETDTAGSLSIKLADLGGKALLKALELMRQGKLTRRRQDDSKATLAPPLSKNDGRIDWQKTAAEISCLMRGLDPWPTTYTELHNKRLRLFLPMVVEKSDIDGGKPAPGTLCRADANGLLIAAGQDCLLVREIQAEGGRRLAVEEFLRGHRLAPGLVFA